MSTNCCDSGCNSNQLLTPKYRKILWVALVVNFTMFLVEVLNGLNAHSVSLMADAIDFFGDAMNYGISLAVLSMSILWRARAALLKGVTMGAFGLFVLASAAWSFMHGKVPEPYTMGIVGIFALIANVSVAAMLYAYREGDANMQSVWLCSRNDAIGNVAVILAALGVFGSGNAWPDLLVAVIMACLATSSSYKITIIAVQEIKTFRINSR